MKLASTKTAAVLIMLLLIITIIPAGIAIEWDGHTEAEIPAWELKWETAGNSGIEAAIAGRADEWTWVRARRPGPFRHLVPLLLGCGLPCLLLEQLPQF